jgi:diaminohydroxyphosphoribosylaminopyrimidine deaminase/5-amino-6-(5-phosphoribosylamino)uracil reductase
MNTDEKYMQRAIDLAKLAKGIVSPNPMVGCVIVKNDTIIGEGFHYSYGESHAEVNAIRSVEDKSKLEGATLYVNLEPCSHTGKTPPCADLIIKYPFKRVVIANIDPNPLVAGKGIETLMQQGMEVVVGVLEAEGRELNKRFFCVMEKHRPFIILKWAETSDGFIARENYESKWISNPVARYMVHQARAEEDVVLVGTNTALYDNPRLNVRLANGRNPVRAFIDKHLQVPAGAHLLDGTQPTLCYTYEKQFSENLVEYVKLDPSLDLVEQLVQDMYDKKYLSVLVEGGAQLLQAFIDKGLWDEVYIYKSSIQFEKGIPAPVFHATPIHIDKIEDNELLHFVNQ